MRLDLEPVNLLRIGDKLVARPKIDRVVDRILELRRQGLSQQETAAAVGVDRPFISRLEALGEVRRGGRVAFVGFPIENKAELEAVVREEGVDFALIMTDAERWKFVNERNGSELVNELMKLVAYLKEFDTVLCFASDMRLRMAEAMLGSQPLVGVSLGPSPIRQDVLVDPSVVRELIRRLKGQGGAL